MPSDRRGWALIVGIGFIILLMCGAGALALFCFLPATRTVPTATPLPTWTYTLVPPDSATPAPPNLATPAPPRSATPSPSDRPLPSPTASITPMSPPDPPTPTLTPTPAPISSPPPTLPAEMAYVPAGSFDMGSSTKLMNVVLAICQSDSVQYSCTDDMFGDERPEHRVSLDAFYIDRHEVTNEQFALFVSDTGYRTLAERDGEGHVVSRGEERRSVAGADWQRPTGPGSTMNGRWDHPVVQVSWHDALAYCQWAGKRLPTEAEWEKAAAGAGGGRVYAWGDAFRCDGANLDDETRLDPYTTHCNDGWAHTAPVGSYASGASACGALDMTGNVREWTADWHSSSYYRSSPSANPAGPALGRYRVTRGGSWYTDKVYARITHRREYSPAFQSDFIGFRCAMDE